MLHMIGKSGWGGVCCVFFGVGLVVMFFMQRWVVVVGNRAGVVRGVVGWKMGGWVGRQGGRREGGGMYTVCYGKKLIRISSE